MMASTTRIVASQQARILRTHEESDLDQITSPDVQAVVYTPSALPDWFNDVAAAVEQEFLQIPRTILPAADQREIDVWLENHLSSDVLAPAGRKALKQDILGLTERLASVTGTSRFHFRIFTGRPTNTCGFHVDTVGPGAVNCGLLRVYNGAGTEYVDPDDVINMRDFYRYLSRRERLERERGEARACGDAEQCTKLDAEIQALDQERAFMTPASIVQVAPSRSIVAFKHLDVRLHWSDHSKALAWIHCSPMSGQPRLVVNVTGAPPGLRTARQGTGEMVR